ncbi:hypothetical protein BJY00DRAFT_315856 [Aspergillus carlsbadensis]|nr:hypothetical protein BJY00DRAFT_315856 [Aspergillus carlsbadensis]
MADPISLAASVAGIVALATSIVQGGYKLYNTVKDCPKELNALLGEVSSLNGVLMGLKAVIEGLASSASAPPSVLDLQQLTDCRAALSEIHGILNQLSGASGRTRAAGTRVAWLWKQGEVQGLIERLERHKSTFALAISGDTLSYAIDLLHLEQPPPAIAYVYFDYRNRTKQSLVYILASVLAQLMMSLAQVPEQIGSLYKASDNGTRSPDENKLLDALLSIAAVVPGGAWILFDALDELDPDVLPGLLGVIALLREKQVQVLITSRPHVASYTTIGGSASRVMVTASKGDIQAMVSHKLRPRNLAPDTVEEISKRISANAHGMFLFASLQLERIIKQPNARKMRQALDVLPLKLGDIYAQTIKRFMKEEGRGELALSIMKWIQVSFRSLTFEELQQAVAIENGDTHFDPDSLTDKATMMECCAGLVNFNQVDGKVGFTHYTLQEYLTANPSDLPDAHLEVTQTCLTYLSLADFKEGTRSQGHHKHSVLLSYAARHWPSHARMAGQDMRLFPALTRLFTSEANFKNAVHARGLYSAYLVPSFITYIFVLGRVELTEFQRCLLLDYATSTTFAEDRRALSPLSLASMFGNEAAVKQLLHQGHTDLNHHDAIRGQTPLIWAAQNGNRNVVEVLLHARELDINARDYKQRTALIWAVRNGHVPVARLLLGYGHIAVTAADNLGYTALTYAYHNENQELVALLTQRKATVG